MQDERIIGIVLDDQDTHYARQVWLGHRLSLALLSGFQVSLKSPDPTALHRWLAQWTGTLVPFKQLIAFIGYV